MLFSFRFCLCKYHPSCPTTRAWLPPEILKKSVSNSQKTHEESPLYDVKIVIGDMNAQVGKEEMYCPTIGKQSLHENTNDNGYRLIQFATLNNMVIGSTLFQHKNIHKPTWTAPYRSFESQIDHMVIDARHMSDLLDIRSYRGGSEVWILIIT